MSTLAEPSDEQLIRYARADRQAFTALYQRYLAPVYHYCYLRLGRREAAEDATSEVFVKALAALDDYRGGAVAAWLFRIAHNTVIDAYRRRHPQASIVEAATLTDPTPTAEQQAADAGLGDKLQAAIDRLPPDQRSVLELQFSGWSVVQIAAALGRSVGAVRMLRLRAIQRLRELLEHEPSWEQDDEQR